MLQWCYRCYNVATVLLPWCYSVVIWLLQCDDMAVIAVFVEALMEQTKQHESKEKWQKEQDRKHELQAISTGIPRVPGRVRERELLLTHYQLSSCLWLQLLRSSMTMEVRL